ncbi:hypothetical protein D1224_14690 [Henriciella barbarensis]|uniref:Uncharacterized protein n=1 Tax=Henriciella barbarensis TaxID=86342 RepID=A0A399QPF9_9PROT|nr:hypothetical protein [Henriciella barbarensis]RIJ20371.1 hypothetical protein D1224_14690 [Henriciella barbarensis]
MSVALNANIRSLLALASLLICAQQVAEAQNTSSVSGPTVSAGEREAEYRLGWVPGTDGRDDDFRHRFDLGLSLSERTAIKIFANFDDNPGGDFSFGNLNAEYLIELSPEDAPFWQTGIRFDGRLSDGPNPDRLGLNWLNQWKFPARLRARAQFIATREIGSNAGETIDFELRSSLIWKASDQYSLSLLSFTDLGNTDDFGANGRGHQLGPAVDGSFGNGVGWTLGALFGVTDRAPDHDIRFWITKSF